MTPEVWIDEDFVPPGRDAWAIIEHLMAKTGKTCGLVSWGYYPQGKDSKDECLGKTSAGQGESAADATDR